MLDTLLKNFFSNVKESLMTETTQKHDCSVQGEQLSATPCCEKETCCKDAVRERAYQLWEEAGCPCCDGENFWLAAEQELTIKSFGVGA
jgi:Zn finger protein HypA/HybF involved in hydrogenase expression